MLCKRIGIVRFLRRSEKYITDEDIIITKNYYSAFVKTELKDRLKKLAIDNLYICGLTINNCIKETSIDAIELGFNVKLVTDCVAASNADKISEYLSLLKNNGIEIIYTNDIIEKPISIMESENR